MGHKFEQALKVGNKQVGSTTGAYVNAITAWDSWRKNNCQPANAQALQQQTGILYANNILYNELQGDGGAWAPGSTAGSGVPTIVADWINAVNAPTTSNAIQFASDWLNRLYSMYSGKTPGTLVNDDAFNNAFANLSSLTVTYNSRAGKYVGAAAVGTTATIPFSPRIMFNVNDYWNWLVQNEADLAQYYATAFVNTGVSGKNTIQIPPFSGNVVPPSLYPASADLATTGGPNYKYLGTQQIMTAVFDFARLVYVGYVESSGAYYQSQSGGGGNKPTCTDTCTLEAGSSTQGWVSDNINGVCVYCTPQPGGTTTCGKESNSHMNKQGVCECNEGYEMAAGNICLPKQHGHGGGGRSKCPKGQSRNSQGVCVKNKDPFHFPTTDVGIVAAVGVVVLVGGLVAYYYA